MTLTLILQVGVHRIDLDIDFLRLGNTLMTLTVILQVNVHRNDLKIDIEVNIHRNDLNIELAGQYMYTPYWP